METGLKEAFDEIDKDGCGQINAAQLETVSKNIGLAVTSAQAQAMIQRCGTRQFSSYLSLVVELSFISTYPLFCSCP